MEPEATEQKRLRAMPGRVILKFPPAAELIGSGLLYGAPNYERRTEIATVYDVGAATNEKEAACAKLLPEGRQIPIRYGNGVMYWEKNDPKHLQWMGDYRAYSITELTAWIPEEAAQPTVADALVALGLSEMPTPDELASLVGGER